MDIRVGQGIDFHRLADNLELWIGGIIIPSEKGSVAHSDGDVLIHAICDAILGSAGLRDIGYYFPDTDEKYHNIASSKLLRETIVLLKNEGYKLSNIDSTVCLEKPRLSGYIDNIRNSLAEICEIDKSRVSVKATTSEKMGFTGSGEGIAAIASVLVKSL